MIKITKSQLNECLEITEFLISWPICAPFVMMDNPKPVDSPKYLQYIRNKPTSLYEIKINLTLNKYDTIASWEDDVNSIWSDAKQYYGRGNTYYELATQASRWFQQRLRDFPESQQGKRARSIFG